MVSDSSAHVSNFNAHRSMQAEPSAWIDRTPDVADVVRLDVLRGALGRLGNIVWSVANAPLLPIGALMESNSLLGLHPTRGEFFEPDPYSSSIRSSTSSGRSANRARKTLDCVRAAYDRQVPATPATARRPWLDAPAGAVRQACRISKTGRPGRPQA